MVCFAHGAGVRVVANAPYPKDQLHNDTYLTGFIAGIVAGASALGVELDGVNFDFEDPLNTTADADALTRVVASTAAAGKAALGDAWQVSIDVAWSPADIDGRGYDYAALVAAVDLAFVMAYDMRSQVFPPAPCVASANSPFPLVQTGALAFTAPPPAGLGLDPSKLILGLPFYGYVYTCIGAPGPTDAVCPIASVPFRGVNCSDAAGYEVCYTGVMSLLRNNATRPYTWNETLAAPFFDYVDDGDGSVRQVWFDDPRSLALKVAFAVAEGWRGVGMWNADCVGNGSPDPVERADAAAMWAALAAVRGGGA
jgi:di-N-acetylchitobiase